MKTTNEVKNEVKNEVIINAFDKACQDWNKKHKIIYVTIPAEKN